MNRTYTNDRSARTRNGGGAAGRGGSRFDSQAPRRSGGYGRRPAAPQGEFALPKTITPALPAVDGFADLASQEARATVARLVADLVRDEIDYGETILRMHEDQFLVLLPARPIGDARTLGERLCVAVRKLALPVAEAADAGEGAVLGLSVGASQMLIGERTPQQALDRAGRALAKARQYGGNQVQAVAGALG